MTELIQAAFSGVNLVYTILLIVMLAYWLVVLLGVIDLDPFGLEMDVDGGGDVGTDAGGHAGGDAGGDGFSWVNYFNVGEVPVMIYASILVITMWIVSLELNYWLDSYEAVWVADYRGWIAAGLALPNLLFAAFVAKLVLTPVRRLRQHQPQHTRLEGKTCLVTSLEVNESFGRCEMPKTDGSLILNARTRSGEILHKGDAAEILEQVHEGDVEYYVVTKKMWDDAPQTA
jgi:hypothetical protein